MSSHLRAPLAFAGTLLLLTTTLLTAGGCSLWTREVSATLRLPDPSKFQACLVPQDPSGQATTAGPVELALFRRGAGTQEEPCSVKDVAQGVATLTRVASERKGGSLKSTPANALALRGLAAGLLETRAGLSSEALKRLSDDGTVPAGMRAATDAMTGEAMQQLHDYSWALLGSPRQGRDDTTLQLTEAGTRGLANAIQEASAYDAWEPLYLCGVGRMDAAEKRLGKLDEKAKLADPQLRAIASVAEASLFLSAYMKAYFRSGQFFDFIVNGGEALAGELTRTLKLAPAEAKALAARVLAQSPLAPDQDGKTHVFTKLSGGFVTRGGKTLAFPDVDVTITPLGASPLTASKIDLTAVGADVIRVFFEAVGDAIARVPGDAKSTGCLTNGETGKPLLECYVPGMSGVRAEDFATINERANAVDGMVGHAVGSVIRGASWFSLNNEALAKVIETAVAAAARKTAEKLAWCYYASGGATTPEARIGLPWASEGQPLKVVIRR